MRPTSWPRRRRRSSGGRRAGSSSYSPHTRPTRRRPRRRDTRTASPASRRGDHPRTTSPTCRTSRPGSGASPGCLGTTLIAFTSDNGYLWGEHRWIDKVVAYEEAIRVPYVVRYDPLVTRPRTDRHLVANIDLA